MQVKDFNVKEYAAEVRTAISLILYKYKQEPLSPATLQSLQYDVECCLQKFDLPIQFRVVSNDKTSTVSLVPSTFKDAVAFYGLGLIEK